MKSILENHLIHNYFKYEICPHNPFSKACDACTALRVIQAMEERINPGEKFLEISLGNLEMKTWNKSFSSLEYFSPQIIRLPSRFQPAPATNNQDWFCTVCGIKPRCDCEKKPPQAPKCECDPKTEGCVLCDLDGHTPYDHKPPAPDRVEERIQEILSWAMGQLKQSYDNALMGGHVNFHRPSWEEKLRALVRAEKGDKHENP